MDRWAQYDARPLTLFLNQNSILKIEKKTAMELLKKKISEALEKRQNKTKTKQLILSSVF